MSSTMSVANPVAQRGTALSLGQDDLTTTEEPPDMNRLKINGSSDQNANSSNLPNTGHESRANKEKTSPLIVPSLSTSLDSSFRRAGMEAKLSPIIPHSPSIADSTGGSASDYDCEHEPDSPSSMSSWNSWAGGRRGDLADVEDLDLDGMMNGEPELETVSEMDEESSGFVSGSDRLGVDSDDDTHQSRPNGRSSASSDQSPRRKLFRLSGEFHANGQASLHPHHPHYHHHASHLHPHGTPLHPHFSPRAGGHGLSHASRHLLRAPPNLAARRRKGRLAELAEEGAGGAISTTKMPALKRSETDSCRDGDTPASSPSTTPQHDTQADEESNSAGDHGGLLSSSAMGEFEMFGPPALPVRSVSPSETIPIVPSPLCVCLTADEQGGVTEMRQDTTPTREALGNSFPLHEEDDDTPNKAALDTMRSGALTPTPPSPTASGRSIETVLTAVSTPPSSPSTSPPLARKGSLRSRRSSSPGRTKPKVPLRPCFKRRGSAQVSTTIRDSSSEREKAPSRGRVKVRFSQAPPTELRTHSPVEYDRKACPVSNRLSPEDLEELRMMKMEMGLLEAKCAALAACKSDIHPSNPRGDATLHAGEWTESESEGESLHPSPDGVGMAERRRADSISSSSPTTFCRNRFTERDGKTDARLTPAEYLRMEREKERERVCRMAGIGTGVGFRYTGGNPSTRQMPHGGCKLLGASSIISRFGLSKPPPPLPGVRAACNSAHSAGSSSPHVQGPNDGGYSGGSSLYRPSSAPPARGPPNKDTYGASSVFPQNEGYGYLQHRDSEPNEAQEPPRGRSMEKSGGRGTNHNSTSTDATDATLTEADLCSSFAHDIPNLTRTCPSPTSFSPERSRSRSPAPPQYDPGQSDGSPVKPTRPGIRPLTGSSNSPSYDVLPTSNSCGYDSPASEFCYESGSEYDLVG